MAVEVNNRVKEFVISQLDLGVIGYSLSKNIEQVKEHFNVMFNIQIDDSEFWAMVEAEYSYDFVD